MTTFLILLLVLLMGLTLFSLIRGVVAFLKTTKGDPVALLHILNTFVDTPADVIANFPQRAAVICGADDDSNGSAHELADILRDGHYFEVPGNHMNAVTRKELGQAMVDFLTA